MKKSVLEQIRVIKVENGYVVNVGERSFVSLDDNGVTEIITGEIPSLLVELDKKQKDETQDALQSERPKPAPETVPTPTSP